MHFIGQVLRHGDPPHFLWGKNLQCRYIRVTLISNVLEFQKAVSITSRYIAMDYKCSLLIKNRNPAGSFFSLGKSKFYETFRKKVFKLRHNSQDTNFNQSRFFCLSWWFYFAVVLLSTSKSNCFLFKVNQAFFLLYYVFTI